MPKKVDPKALDDFYASLCPPLDPKGFDRKPSDWDEEKERMRTEKELKKLGEEADCQWGNCLPTK